MKKAIFITISGLTLSLVLVLLFKPQLISNFSIKDSYKNLINKISFKNLNRNKTEEVKEYNPSQNANKDLPPPEFTEGSVQIEARECAFEQGSGNEINTILLYVTGDYIRADSMISSEDGTVFRKSHIISTGDYTYTWQQGSSTGFRFQSSKQNTEGYYNPFELASINSIREIAMLNENCSNVMVNEKIYGIPENIEFKELQLDVGNINNASKDTLCNICKDITEESLLDKCREAFSCE